MRNSFLFAFVLFCMIPAAFAQMDGDFSSGGAIMVGASTTTCDAAATGGIRYSGGVIQWCNGTAWANIASGSSGAIDDLTDAYTIYDAGVTSNFIMGRAGAAALTAGAQGNLFIGELAGATTAASTATTDFNTAVGYNVLTALTSGAYNTGMGSYSLSNVTSGLYNTAYGYKTLRLVTTGGFNAGIGDFVLEATTTGNLNSSVGSGSLKLNTTGSYNVAVGSNALASNVAKRESTAVGYQAIQYADDTATAAVTWNTAVGAYALRGSATASANTGTNNTAIGHSALLGNTSGSNSVAVGKNALTAATTGGTNTAVGSLAGDSITTGTGNIVIGYNVDTSAAGASNELNIGGTIYADLSTDKVGIGVVSPASALDVNGGVKIANDAAACVAGKAGTLRYTGGTPPWEYCNGSAWSPFEQAGCAGPADCSTVGSVCTDGSVFAGCVPPTFVTPFFATRCDAGQTWGGASCTGTRTATIQWNNGNSTGNILTNINDYIDGEANTTALQVGGAQQDSDSGVGGVQPHQAADYCATLNIHGETDWYLPSRAELHQMCINRTAIGNFVNGAFWTSTETASTTAAYQFIGSSCDQSSTTKSSGATEYVRCIRK